MMSTTTDGAVDVIVAVTTYHTSRHRVFRNAVGFILATGEYCRHHLEDGRVSDIQCKKVDEPTSGIGHFIGCGNISTSDVDFQL
jgi:hypothetical protein